MLRRLLVLSPVVSFAMAVFAQMARPVEASLPSDPMELATGATMLLNTPENRTTVLGLLERARQSVSELYAEGAPPFALKVSFTASGQSAYVGEGEMDEVRYNRQMWRWSARLGDYSQRRIFHHGIAFDQKPLGPIPLRIQMVRDLVIWPMFPVRPGAAMRMAAAKWEGTDVMCALMADRERSSAGTGRQWQEQEYCIDTKAGLLRMYSAAPGIYATYDYNDALQFHGRVLARNISVTEAGSPVLQVHIESLEDAPHPDPAAFMPTKEMMDQGPGIVLRAPVRFAIMAPAPPSAAEQTVVIHAAIDRDGKVVEAEALQTSDPNLSNAALTLVRNSIYAKQEEGIMPRQQEAFIEVDFRKSGG